MKTSNTAIQVDRLTRSSPLSPRLLPAPAQGEGLDGGSGSDPSALPCLYSHISTENHSKLNILSANNRRSAHVLAESVSQLANKYGLNNLGFLTLTFSQHITDPAEAQRRLNSLITHVIKHRYQDYLGVFERQKSGRIHYHILVALHDDIRTGVNFELIQAGNYTTAPPSLRSEWAYWRKTAKAYGFGRTELMPIRSTAAAISRYVGKYISKHIEQRNTDDKGVRLVRYSRGARAGTTKFQFLTKGSAQWRAKIALFALIVSGWKGVDVNNMADLSRILGKRWAYSYREFILGLPDLPLINQNNNSVTPGLS